MLTTSTYAVLGSLALTLALPTEPRTADELSPPSLVQVPGGRTTIGSDRKDIEELLKANENAVGALRSLDAETPAKPMEVETFHMMVTECTNEQYAEFVRATGHRPPLEWAHPEDLSEARNAFLKAEQDTKQEWAAQGRRYKTEKFDNAKWWDSNWAEARWEIPKNQERLPVVRVDYSDAMAYCTWAGLRLPSEFEFQRAGRGKTKQLYPWGDEWEDNKFAVTSEVSRSTRLPVASKPAGASEFGVHDLAGNVWEWTSSGYLPYKGYKANEYKIDKKKVTRPASWNGSQRVAVGGSYQNSSLVARLTTRRPTDRTQLTNAMGFRAAASTRVAYDVAVGIAEQVIKPSDIRGGVVFDPNISVGLDRWTSKPSAQSDAPEGYSVITGYDYITFVPAKQLETKGDMGKLEKASLDEAVHFGFLATSKPILEPALDPGSYFISFRGKGKSREKRDPNDPVPLLDVTEKVDINQDNLLIFNAVTEELVHALPLTGASMTKPKNPSTIENSIKKVWEGTGDDQVQVEQHWMTVNAVVPTALKTRALVFELPLRVSQETAEMDWRK